MLGAFDCFLFPSRWEGLGLALVEAQAAGLRCFVSTAVPLDAVVIPSLVQQFPLSAGPELWAEAILQRIHAPTLSHERKRCAQSLRHSTFEETRLNWSNSIGRLAREKFAVLIPVYRNPAGLHRSLASLREANGGFDIVIVDDGSPEPVSVPSRLREDLAFLCYGSSET